jgi:MFS family permease
MAANYIAVPTRAPLVLRHFKGDAVKTAGLMSSMSSTCALIELFTNPALASVADKIGRRPVLTIGSLVNGSLHVLVGLFPGNIDVNFWDRSITGAVTYTQLANSNAALSDIFSGDELAAANSFKASFWGAGMVVGPALGGYVGNLLGPDKAFLLSGVMYLLTGLAIQMKVPETLVVAPRLAGGGGSGGGGGGGAKKETGNGSLGLGEAAKGGPSMQSLNPLRFFKLFQNWTMGRLAVILALQVPSSVCTSVHHCYNLA